MIRRLGSAALRAISACLLGVACRYDGRRLPNDGLIQIAGQESPVPICPEQLGGLPTPRPPAEIKGGTGADVLDGRARVMDDEGRDVTAAFVRGATETLRLCERLGVSEVVLKSRSPSCGAGEIYNNRVLINGDGVTAALLRRQGIQVIPY